MVAYEKEVVHKSKQEQKLFAEGIKQINIGRGISSVTGTLLTWGVSVEYSY